MITASVAEDDITAAAYGVEYPFAFISGMRIEPSAATSATAEPEISAKNIDAPIVTIAKPPLTNPTSAEAKAISRCEIPEAFMIAPASTNSGIAMSGNLVVPENNTSAMLGTASNPDVNITATTDTTPSANAIGTFTATSAIKPSKSRRSIIANQSVFAPHPNPSTRRR